MGAGIRSECFIRCVAEHHPLIAGAKHPSGCGPTPGWMSWGCLAQYKPNLNLAQPRVDAGFCTRIAGRAQNISNQAIRLLPARRWKSSGLRVLNSGNNHALRSASMVSHATRALRITFQKCIQDAVKDRVGKFVRVPFKKRILKRKAISNCHCQSPFGCVRLVV